MSTLNPLGAMVILLWGKRGSEEGEEQCYKELSNSHRFFMCLCPTQASAELNSFFMDNFYLDHSEMDTTKRRHKVLQNVRF